MNNSRSSSDTTSSNIGSGRCLGSDSSHRLANSLSKCLIQMLLAVLTAVAATKSASAAAAAGWL